MPGLSGLETLIKLKDKRSVVCYNDNQKRGESIMEEAIGSKISDYLIKPVNPIDFIIHKKHIDSERLVSQKQMLIIKSLELGMKLGASMNKEEWEELFKK